MKLIVYTKIFIMFASLINFFSVAEEPKLSWDKAEPTIRHFRIFEGRYISGSGQFTEANIDQLAKKVEEIAGKIEVILVDTRLESHLFVNGLPLTWKVPKNDANIDKTTKEILKDEKDKISKIFEAKIVDSVVVETLATEKQLATKKGFDYVRLPTLDHSRPSDEIVDAFLELIKKNPNAWFHVHCHVGKGRTTTFMTLYDMFYNAKEVEFDEILERQKEIDGEDFKKYLQKTNLESYMKNLYDERLKFLKRFYDFCKNSDPQHITWTEWLQQESQI